MKVLAIAVLGALFFTCCFGQGDKIVVRRQPVQIRIRHADPWAVRALLEGQSIASPEISTVMALMGMPQQATQNSKGLFDDGKFLVNPADNSLWFIPNN